MNAKAITDPTVLADLRALLTAMHAAGWRHRIRHEESGRDADGAPWHSGWYEHSWRRRSEEITVWRQVDSGRLEFAINYWGAAADPDEDPAERISVDLDWVARRGITRLHRMAEAAGILEATA